MLLSAVYVLVVAHSSSEVPEGLMNNPVLSVITIESRSSTRFKLNVVSEIGLGHVRNGKGSRVSENVYRCKLILIKYEGV